MRHFATTFEAGNHVFCWTNLKHLLFSVPLDCVTSAKPCHAARSTLPTMHKVVLMDKYTSSPNHKPAIIQRKMFWPVSRTRTCLQTMCAMLNPSYASVYLKLQTYWSTLLVTWRNHMTPSYSLIIFKLRTPAFKFKLEFSNFSRPRVTSVLYYMPIFRRA